MRGSCLCGGVQYEITGQLGDITHCHCTTCRKAHGAAFSSVAAVQIKDFNCLEGSEFLKSFQSSPGKRRYFCSNCGSHIYAHREEQEHYVLRLGTLDDDPEVRPVNHIWVSLKAPWYEIAEDAQLPQFSEWPDDRT
ncbi:MAG: GFA family protein [Chromatiales bacterium]|nr:GFA family protein [Chromatiales bacterium]